MKAGLTLALRQFGALATVLQRNVLRNTKLRLTIFYVVVLLLTLFAADAITNYNQLWLLQQNIQTEIQNPATEKTAQNVAEETAKEVKGTNYLIYIILTAAVGGISYFLADRSLRPLNRIMEAQKRFLANASHELRTPLSVMKTDCEVALREGDDASKEELREILAQNIKEIDRMGAIINNLLLISHSAQDTNKMPFMPVNFADVIERIRPPLERFAEERGVSFIVSSIPTAEVRGNLIALEEIGLNIAKNAITYTPRGGSVVLALMRTRYGVEFVVKDTGIGISETDMPSIFEPFYKSRRGERYGRSGSGLGLAIVRELVDLHSGRIRVTSAPNQGTTVRLTFPTA